MALTYVRNVQRVTYMWRKGLNKVKIVSKWALLSRLSTPNGRRSYLERHIFDPSLTRLWSQNSSVSRLIGTSEGAKKAQTGLKMGSKHFFVVPKWSTITLGKNTFLTIFDRILVLKRPIFKALWDLPCPKMHHHEVKMG